MTRIPLLCLAAAAALALAAPRAPAADQWTGARQRQAATPVSWDELSHAKWIADGRDDAPRKVYVFMDANCKYCTKFWSDARPWVNSGKVQLRHIMVAVIAPTSAGKAATLLVDPDPAKRLYAYEQTHAFGVVRMMAGGPHHSWEDPNLQPMQTIPPAVGRTLQDDERLMDALGLTGTPGIVYRGLGGRLVARGGIAPEEMTTVLGAL